MATQNELICEFCNKQFSVKNSLNIHKKVLNIVLFYKEKMQLKNLVVNFVIKILH